MPEPFFSVLLETPSYPNEPEYEKMTKTLYRSCNDLETLSRLTLEPLKSLIAELGGWPVVEGTKWNAGKYETWEESNAAIAASTGVDSIFGLAIDVDMKDTTRRMLAVRNCLVRQMPRTFRHLALRALSSNLRKSL